MIDFNELKKVKEEDELLDKMVSVTTKSPRQQPIQGILDKINNSFIILRSVSPESEKELKELAKLQNGYITNFAIISKADILSIAVMKKVNLKDSNEKTTKSS